ncbi:di-trans,poly-cis-decaprenylcistransferase [Candidatus Saccharibacteria bacterium]|nr:di-trans,poly-cis-decaprenylcistransferase [Candidatus Saccharibacteria bacterium]
MQKSSLPRHIGFILDGNRRWAKDNSLPKFVGHKKGYDNLKTIAEECFDLGIEVVSAYIFSTENWNRELEEVNYLMELVLKIFTADLKELNDKGIKIVVSGNYERLDEKIIKAIKGATKQTAANTKGTINLCFNYGGQVEIADAVKKIVQKGIAVDDISVALIRENLYHPELPPVDYIVRTSGEQRLSNFLLWDSAYAELEFVPIYWPDFDKQELVKVLGSYIKRLRRFGK